MTKNIIKENEMKTGICDKLKVKEKYPKLKIHNCEPKFIVLFNSEDSGMVVHNFGEDCISGNRVGDFSTLWDKKSFSDFNDGKVFLENNQVETKK